MWSAGERKEKEANEVNFMKMRNEKGSSNIIQEFIKFYKDKGIFIKAV